MGTRASRPRRVCGGLRWRIGFFPVKVVCMCSLQFENTINAEAQRFESHERLCESVLWGRGRLARGGFAVCSYGRSATTANCTLFRGIQKSGISASSPSTRVHKEHILPPLRGLFFALSVPGVPLRSTPVCILAPLRGLKLRELCGLCVRLYALPVQ